MSEIAVYKNKEYDASINTSKGYVWLRSKSSEDLKNGFELENGIYYKKVSFAFVNYLRVVTESVKFHTRKETIVKTKNIPQWLQQNVIDVK